MKKILILGGKPIGSIELVKAAQKRGCYVIVTDYLPIVESPAKQISDERWDISTADVDVLEAKCIESHIDGILTAVHEFNINRMIDLCERLNLPCYCRRDTWKYCDDKSEFKSLCESAGISVARKYDLGFLTEDELCSIKYPVVTKPIDGSGSRGFRICHNIEELRKGYTHALENSPTKRVLVEDYIPYDAVIIHYTMNQGRCYFSGMSDKYSVRFPSTGASVMGLQIFPSKGIKQYLETQDAKVRSMFELAGFTDGPIWIEAFYDGKEEFVFNEMGYRFGGSLTNYPVQYFYQIDQLDQMINVALGKDSIIFPIKQKRTKKYCILPIHVHAGKIASVIGQKNVEARDDVYAYVPVHFIGDEIQEWGSAQQVYCYLHVLFDDMNELRNIIKNILDTLSVTNENGHSLLFTLFDIDKIIEN